MPEPRRGPAATRDVRPGIVPVTGSVTVAPRRAAGTLAPRTRQRRPGARPTPMQPTPDLRLVPGHAGESDGPAAAASAAAATGTQLSNAGLGPEPGSLESRARRRRVSRRSSLTSASESDVLVPCGGEPEPTVPPADSDGGSGPAVVGRRPSGPGAGAQQLSHTGPRRRALGRPGAHSKAADTGPQAQWSRPGPTVQWHRPPRPGPLALR